MSFQVDKALVQGYKNNIEIQFQQAGSRLRPYVRVERQNAEFDFYDRITPVSAQKVTNRHGDTPLISTPHDRRRVALEDYDWADLIDREDKIRMLADPTSPYVRNGAMALGRSVDDTLITAAFGTAYTGKTGSGTQAWPGSGQEVAVDYDDDGGSGDVSLTVGKLRRARTIMGAQEAIMGDDTDSLVCVCAPAQIQALLRSTEVTSADYNTVKALAAGQVDTYMGFKFVMSNRLPVDGSSDVEVLAFERDGLLLAMADEIKVDVGPRRDKRNSTQVYVCGSFGASRMWEAKVVKILCDPA